MSTGNLNRKTIHNSDKNRIKAHLIPYIWVDWTINPISMVNYGHLMISLTGIDVCYVNVAGTMGLYCQKENHCMQSMLVHSHLPHVFCPKQWRCISWPYAIVNNIHLWNEKYDNFHCWRSAIDLIIEHLQPNIIYGNLVNSSDGELFLFALFFGPCMRVGL